MPEELTLVTRSMPEPSPTMRDLLGVVFRQWRLLWRAFALTFVLTLAYGFVTRSYQAEMKVLLRRERVDPVVTSAPSGAEFVRSGVTEEEVNSEAELLQDNEILRATVEHAGLTSEGRSWLDMLSGQTDEQRLARAVRRISRHLTIEPVRKTALITVRYDSSDAQKGARLLRSLANAYLERHHQVHRPSGQVNFFDQQLVLARGNLEAAEMQLMEFSRDQGVVSAAQERDIALQKLSDADANNRQTLVAIAENAERIRMLQVKLNAIPERTLTVVRNSDNPQLMEKIKGRLLELELKRTELLTEYEPAYRLVREVDQEIAQAKAAVVEEEQAPIRDQTSDLEPNHEWAKSQLLHAQVEAGALAVHATAETALLTHYRDLAHQLGDRAITQERLLHDLKGAEDKYLLYVNKREEARIGDALDQGGILNVAIAEQPTAPALPKTPGLTVTLIGLAAATTLSLGLAFVTDRLSPSFRTPDEIVAALGTPVLASLPCRAQEDADGMARGRR